MYQCENCGKEIIKLTPACRMEPDLAGRSWKYYCEECSHALFEPSSFEKPLVYFENIGVKIIFRNENNKRKAISAHCEIGFTETEMQITARKLSDLLSKGKSGKLEGLPKIDEENLYRLKTLAKELKVPWWYLMDISFNLENVVSKGFTFRWGAHGSTNLILRVNSPHGEILVELVKKKFNARSPADQLVKIDRIVHKHSIKE
ncbi:MAG: hypothetical protein HWN65_02515 [Candidatus Helarchaeota archaeon]|nr:hypothetical protein [Candidatus Helarchaeota archaeon]